jgi:hypothetical protein
MATSSAGPVRGRVDALADVLQAVHNDNVERFWTARQRYISMGWYEEVPQREEWTHDYHETRARMEQSYDVLRMVRLLQVNLDSNPPDAQQAETPPLGVRWWWRASADDGSQVRQQTGDERIWQTTRR